MTFFGQHHDIIQGPKGSGENVTFTFSVLEPSRPADIVQIGGKVTCSPWESDCKMNLNVTGSKQEENRMSGISRVCYGVGHVFNDLCASMWFSHLLVFFDKVVQLSATEAGLLLLIGQIVDGLATPIIGIESDRTTYTKYGKRKVWHLGGVIAVALTFSFIFNLCISCENSSHWSLFVYYVPFIIIFQIGWAAVQISHLSLIPDLASTSNEKVILNALRYETTYCIIFIFALGSSH